MRSWCAFGAALATAFAPLVEAEAQEPQRRLSGVVRDSAGGAIPYAQVALRRAGLRVTDDSGAFVFDVGQLEAVELDVRRIGFRPVELRLDRVPDTALAVTMTPVALSLPSVHAEAGKVSASLELHGFYQRLRDRERGLGSGHFITPEDLERRRATRASHVLDGVPGVRMVRVAGPFNRMAALGSDRCPYTIYVDRIRLNKLGRTADLPDIDEVVTPNAVAGIEIYARRTAAPQGFEAANGTCGVILIWTR